MSLTDFSLHDLHDLHDWINLHDPGFSISVKSPKNRVRILRSKHLTPPDGQARHSQRPRAA